jgi:hypothetical protein
MHRLAVGIRGPLEPIGRLPSLWERLPLAFPVHGPIRARFHNEASAMPTLIAVDVYRAMNLRDVYYTSLFASEARHDDGSQSTADRYTPCVTVREPPSIFRR